MTALQLINSFFYLLIYPFVIKTVGITDFGLFVFATSVATYFVVFVNFGFDIHAAKLVSLSPDNAPGHSSLLWSITTAKLCLAVMALLVFMTLIELVPFMGANAGLFWIAFSNVLSAVFLPTWLFHGMQKMKLITISQLVLKLLSLPVIYYFLSNGYNVNSYALIVVITNVAAAIAAFYIAVRIVKFHFILPSKAEVLAITLEVQPFFWSAATNTLKQKSVEIIIGALFGMREVAIYDLASKIFSVPSLLASNVNAALFPMMMKNSSRKLVNRIIKVEIFIGLGCIAAVALGGYWIIELIFSHEMAEAYPIAVLLSLNIMTYLVVGSHIYFVYVPRQRYDIVLRNQVLSLVTFYFFTALYLWVSWSVYAVVFALVTSAFIEIVYSCALLRKIREY